MKHATVTYEVNIAPPPPKWFKFLVAFILLVIVLAPFILIYLSIK